MSTTIRDEVRTARKAYRCDYCGAEIKAGDRYSAWYVADAGSVFSGRGHSQCITMHDSMAQPWWEGEMMDWSEFRAVCGEELPEMSPYPWESAS